MFPALLPVARYLVWTWKRRKNFPLSNSNLHFCSRLYLNYIRIRIDLYRSI